MLKWHLIPLDSVRAESGSNKLFLRIYSDRPENIGTGDLQNYDKVWLGSQMALFKVMVGVSAELLILGFVSACVGLFSVFVYFRRRNAC